MPAKECGILLRWERVWGNKVVLCAWNKLGMDKKLREQKFFALAKNLLSVKSFRYSASSLSKNREK